MSTREKILDDVARIAGGTVGVLNDIKGQTGQAVRTYVDSLAQDMDLVPREDFERLEAVIEGLNKTLAEMEKRIASLEKPSTKKK